MSVSYKDMSVRELRELYHVSDDDIAAVRALGKKLGPRLEEAIDLFYDWLKGQEEYEEFFHEDETLNRVSHMQHQYWKRFFEAELDDDYVRAREMVGETHARIGLPLHIYLAAMNHMQQVFIADMAKVDAETAMAMTRMMHFDTSVVVLAYARVTGETIGAQSKALLEMSTPVTQVWDGILLMPLVGIIDSMRARDVMSAMLSKVSDTRARIFILDIAGVAVVDTAVANHLIKITRATRLMGCTCIISGVSPAIAETIVELGIDIGTVKTTGTLMDAISMSFDHTGVRIERVE
jgi:rsbT co-antagonist protein RsbR